MGYATHMGDTSGLLRGPSGTLSSRDAACEAGAQDFAGTHHRRTLSSLARRGLAPRDNLFLHLLDIIGGVFLFHELLVIADEGSVTVGWSNLQLAREGQSSHRFLVCGKGSVGAGRRNVSRIGRRGYACIGGRIRKYRQRFRRQ